MYEWERIVFELKLKWVDLSANWKTNEGWDTSFLPTSSTSSSTYPSRFADPSNTLATRVMLFLLNLLLLAPWYFPTSPCCYYTLVFLAEDVSSTFAKSSLLCQLTRDRSMEVSDVREGPDAAVEEGEGRGREEGWEGCLLKITGINSVGERGGVTVRVAE